IVEIESINEEIFTPVSGEVHPISEIKDEVFASQSMGQGVYIVPKDNNIYAPFDGEVVMVANTKHAIGLKSEHGVEILIHVGMDTVELNGEGFQVFVEPEEKVKKGQKLMTFDSAFIRNKGYSLDIPVVCTNGLDIQMNHNTHADLSEVLFTTM
uniref:PTS sugar transporter subunit IIA n=1 Tax=Faecalitalea cylindroides TaxID=39483 RepID=UPI003AB67AAC